jgi:hypothetical protein
MKEIFRRNANIFGALLGIIIVLVIYTLFASVDLVFMKGDFQVARMENVRVFSDIELDVEDVVTGEDLEYTYSDDTSKTYEPDMSLRIEIAKTSVLNLLNVIKGEEIVDSIVFVAK